MLTKEMNRVIPMDELNKRIVFQRAVPDVDDPPGRERARKFYVQYYSDCVERLEKFRAYVRDTESIFAARGAPPTEVATWRAGTINEHINLLEAVIRAKRHAEWMDKGLRELLNEKVKLLESMV